MNLESHDKYSIVFDNTCTQSLNGAADNCSNHPTFTSSALDSSTLTGVGSDFVDK